MSIVNKKYLMEVISTYFYYIFYVLLPLYIGMNSVRLGTYQTVDNYGWNRNSNGELNHALCIFWGGVSGIFGSTIGCPLYMIKTQMQAQSHGKYAVGFQHGHKSTLDAFRRILAESGVKGNG